MLRAMKKIELPTPNVASARLLAFQFLARTLVWVGIISLILSWDSRYADPLKLVIYRVLEYARGIISHIV